MGKKNTHTHIACGCDYCTAISLFNKTIILVLEKSKVNLLSILTVSALLGACQQR